MPEVAEAPEPAVEIPPSERKEITRMADAFKNAMKATEPKPSVTQAQPQPQPQPAKPTKPSETAQPAPPAETGDPVLPGEVKGKTRESFDRLEGMMKKYRGDYEATKAELEKVKKNGNPELDELRKQLAEREKVLAAVAIERHPGFQKLFGDRLQTAVADAREAIGAENAATVEAVFAMPAGAQRDSQIELLTEGLTDFKKIALHDAYKNLKTIERDKALELSRAPDTLKAIREHNERQAREAELQNIRQRAALVQHITAQIEPDLADADPELAKSIVADAKRFVDGGDAELYVRTATDAARWRRHEATLKQQAEHIAKLEAQLSEIQASNPTVQSVVASSSRRPLPPMDNSDIGPKFRKAISGGISRAA